MHQQQQKTGACHIQMLISLSLDRWQVSHSIPFFNLHAAGQRSFKEMTIDILSSLAAILSSLAARAECECDGGMKCIHDSHHLNSFRVRISDNDNDGDGSSGSPKASLSHRRSITLCFTWRMRARRVKPVCQSSRGQCVLVFNTISDKNDEKKK